MRPVDIMRAVAAIVALAAVGCTSAPTVESPPASVVGSITYAEPQPRRVFPPEWSGLSGTIVVPGSVKTHPGEHAVGSLVMEQARQWRRTGRLAEAFAVEGRDDLALPAGTPLRAVQFLYARPVYPRGQRVPETHDWNWCADTTPDTSVCFAWIEAGVVLVGTMTGDLPSSRNPPNRIRAPEPVIIEQAVDTFPRSIRRVTVKSIAAEGVIYNVSMHEGAYESSYVSSLIPWGEAYTTYIGEDAASEVRATPVSNGDGTPSKASVTITPLPPAAAN
jgi:hypothetical protein